LIPESERFTEFKSGHGQDAERQRLTYGAAGDRDGNGWWAEMIIDIVNKGDVRGPASRIELKLPRVVVDKDMIGEEARKFLRELHTRPTSTRRCRGTRGRGGWARTRRRTCCGSANSWGGTLAKIDTRTMETSFVPLPGPRRDGSPITSRSTPSHNAWLNIWSSDVILKYDPTANTWTTFDLPTRGHGGALHLAARARRRDAR